MTEVQGSVDPTYNWDYYAKLKAFVDGGMVAPSAFIDGVSGIVNR
jgi:hypothetical protein